MNKTLTIIVALFILFTSTVEAHPGNTDSSGGHTCRTNCDDWGYGYGEYHYHGGYEPAPVYDEPDYSEYEYLDREDVDPEYSEPEYEEPLTFPTVTPTPTPEEDYYPVSSTDDTTSLVQSASTTTDDGVGFWSFVFFGIVGYIALHKFSNRVKVEKKDNPHA